MLDEDQDTLAAEYVLGTLSAEEREHAEALLTFDSTFEAAVRQWERRLGELNVMVEAVEPPAELWDRIKHDVTPVGAAVATDAAEVTHDLEEPAAASDHLPLLEEHEPGHEHDHEPAHESEHAEETHAVPHEEAPIVVEPADVQQVDHSADVIRLGKRARRWRGLTLAIGAIAALLALYVAAWHAAPDLIPAQLRPGGAGMIARTDGSARSQQDRLVVVLQQQPTAPAFLVTLDTQQRTLYVRRVSATAEAGKSYELWLISKSLGAPRSLGVVGGDEFTQRPLPGSFDVDTLRTAGFAVSLEPAGGSKTGAPTGPILFTGKAVESLPASQPSKPART
jgi:anti-sigma-K factor RskA